MLLAQCQWCFISWKVEELHCSRPEQQRKHWPGVVSEHGAPPHFTMTVHEVLNEALPGWWIGSGSATSVLPKSRPSHSPDLTAPDYSLWGIIKDKMAGHCCNTTYAWKVSQKDALTQTSCAKNDSPHKDLLDPQNSGMMK